MPSSVICHNYALPGVTWLDLNDSDTLAPLLCLSQIKGGGGKKQSMKYECQVCPCWKKNDFIVKSNSSSFSGLKAVSWWYFLSDFFCQLQHLVRINE